MKIIPQDPIICLSFINTQLRDYYRDIDELCRDFGVDRQELEGRLKLAGFHYTPELNQFR